MWKEFMFIRQQNESNLFIFLFITYGEHQSLNFIKTDPCRIKLYSCWNSLQLKSSVIWAEVLLIRIVN